MQLHGEGPKVFFVKAHAKWLNGKLQHVESYLRAMTPPLGFEHSSLQLTFGFMHSEPI
jgi:hypothetical protein